MCEEDRGRVVDGHGVVDGVGAAEDDGCRALVDWAFGNREVWERVERLWLDPDLVEDVWYASPMTILWRRGAMSDRVALVVTVFMSADVRSTSRIFARASVAVNDCLAAGYRSRGMTQVQPGVVEML